MPQRRHPNRRPPWRRNLLSRRGPTDLPAVPATPIGGGESFSVIAVGEDFRPELLAPQDELASVVALEIDDDWPIQQQAMTASAVARAAALSLAVALGLPQGAGDELGPPAQDDSYQSRDGNVQPLVVAAAITAHEDFPQPVAVFVDEDYRQEPVTAQDEIVLVNFPTGGSFPSVVTAALEEGYTLDLKAVQDRISSDTPLTDDALPAVITPSEDYWWRDERAQPTATQVQAWADEGFQAPAITVDEAYQHQPYSAPDEVVLVSFATGVGYPSVAPAPSPDEPYFLDPRAAFTPTWNYVIATQDDLPVSLSGGGFYSPSAPRQQYGIGFVRMGFAEELPGGTQFADESADQPGQQVVARAGPILASFGDVEELPFFSIDDAEWKTYWIAPQLWTDFANTAEAIPPQPEPLNVEVVEWNGYWIAQRLWTDFANTAEAIPPQPEPLNLEDVYDTSISVPIAPPVAVVFGADEQGGEFIVPPVVEARDLGAKWPVKVTEYLTKIKDRFYWFRDESELPEEEKTPRSVLKVAQIEKTEIAPTTPKQAQVDVQSAADVAKRKRIEEMNEAIMKLFL